MLKSNYRLLHHLSRGKRTIKYYENLHKPIEAMCIVSFTDSQAKEITRVAEYANLNVSTLNPAALTQSVMKSFTAEKVHATISSYKIWFLSEKAHAYLGQYFRLIDQDDTAFRMMALGVLDRVVDGLRNPDPHGIVRVFYGTDEQHPQYKADCLYILHKLVVSIENPPLQEVAASNAVRHLMLLIRDEDEDYSVRSKSAQIVVKLLTETPDGIESDGKVDRRTSLCSLLLSGKADLYHSRAYLSIIESMTSSDFIGTAAARVLSSIRLEKEIIPALVDLGVISKLMECMSKCCDLSVKSAIEAMSAIAVVSKDYLAIMLESGLVKTMSQKNQAWWIGFISHIIRVYQDTAFLQDILDHVDIGLLCWTLMRFFGDNRIGIGGFKILNAILVNLGPERIEIALSGMKGPEKLQYSSMKDAIQVLANWVLIIPTSNRDYQKALEFFTVIAQYSAQYQEHVFNSGIIEHVSKRLKTEDPDQRYPKMLEDFASLLRAVSLRGREMLLARKIIDVELAPLLVEMTASCQDGSMALLMAVVTEDPSSIDGLVSVNLVPNLVSFLKLGHPQGQRDTIQDALDLLCKIACHSSCYKDKVINSGVLDLLHLSINEPSTEIRSRWTAIQSLLESEH